MSSSVEQHLCVFMAAAVQEEELKRSREVGCQWESPEGEKREVGCQSDPAERRDAGVQVDLLTQQLSDSSAVLLQCFSVRPDGPDGGALLQHCTTKRTRTRTIKSPIQSEFLSDASSTPARPKRTQRRRRSQQQGSNRTITAVVSQRPCTSPPSEVLQHEQEREEVHEEVLTEDPADPTWTPFEEEPRPDFQHSAVRAVKLEPNSTMCEVCGKVMKKSSLAQHSFIHTGRKPFPCHLCELRFNRRGNLQHHLTRMHPNGVAKLEKRRKVQTWLCEVCGKTFNCRSALKLHEVIHSGVKAHRCDLCPKAYMRIYELNHHKRMVHVDGQVVPGHSGSLLCDCCGKEFKYKSQLALHVQTHTGERPYHCDACGRKFGRQRYLERHKTLVHATQVNDEGSQSPDEAPFPCSVCGKRMKSEALLASHSRIHGSDKPHRCSICLRSFLCSTSLKQHHLRVHLKVRVNEVAKVQRRKAALAKMFPCSVCGKVFRFRSLLAGHAMIHSEVRPYACDFCSRSFKRSSHLKKHRETVHANGACLPESFVCHICGKDKKCRSQLSMHLMIHTGERPFACDLCAARFNRRGNLQQHQRAIHGVGCPPLKEAPPILFDDDGETVTCKEEETVISLDLSSDS